MALLNDKMPAFQDKKDLWFQMYENLSAGTPLSPPMSTKKLLAEWLAKNNVSAFGRNTATEEEWLKMIERGEESLGFVALKDGEIVSGITFVGRCC
jgi:hypothetical protein